MRTDGFQQEHTGGGCTALVRYFGNNGETDAGAIVITTANDPLAPQHDDEEVIVGVYAPNVFRDCGESIAAYYATAGEAVAWGREQTSLHEARARVPSHWQQA